MLFEVVILAVAALGSLAGSPPAGKTYGTAWRYSGESDVAVRLPALVPVVISMSGAGSDPAEEIVEFEVTAKFPDAMMANRLEDLTGIDDPAFWKDVKCNGVPVIRVPPSLKGRPPQEGTSQWPVCTVICNPPSRLQCSWPQGAANYIDRCTCSAEEKAKGKALEERAKVATGRLVLTSALGHVEWVVAAPSPARVLGSSMVGIVLETYLPAEAVGKEVGWRTVALRDAKTGVSVIEARPDPAAPVTSPPPTTAPPTSAPEARGGGYERYEGDALAAALTIFVLLALALGAVLAFFLLRKKIPTDRIRAAFRRAPADEKEASAKETAGDCCEL